MFQSPRCVSFSKSVNPETETNNGKIIGSPVNYDCPLLSAHNGKSVFQNRKFHSLLLVFGIIF